MFFLVASNMGKTPEFNGLSDFEFPDFNGRPISLGFENP